MPTFTAAFLLQTCTDLFAALGAPRDEARLAAEELVESSLMGYDSHGVMRAAQYARELTEGRIKPGAPVTIARETPTTAVVDCGFTFGAVAAARMAEIACDKASHLGVACVVSRDCQHVGRLGAWVQRIAARGLIGLAFVTNTRGGHSVAPWGGREGRLGTNPLAWAAPVRHGPPILLDMATCMMPEGKIRVSLHAGKPLPPGHVLDAAGNPTTDPAAFYGPPRGAILPFGGQYGYKGFGLGLLVEVLGGTLAGYAMSAALAHQNGLCLIAISPAAFCGEDEFAALIDDMRAYVTDVPTLPGVDAVQLPGAPDFRIREQRLRDGIALPDETWRQIVEAAERAGLRLDWDR